MSDNTAEVRRAIELCFSDPQNESHLRRFDDLFRPLVMAILVSLYRKDPAFVEDAYQSAFIKYIEIFRRGKKEGVVYDAYFAAIAKNSLLDELRRNAKEVPLDEILALPTPSRGSELGEQDAGIAFFQALSQTRATWVLARSDFCDQKHSFLFADDTASDTGAGLSAAPAQE